MNFGFSIEQNREGVSKDYAGTQRKERRDIGLLPNESPLVFFSGTIRNWMFGWEEGGGPAEREKQEESSYEGHDWCIMVGHNVSLLDPFLVANETGNKRPVYSSKHIDAGDLIVVEYSWIGGQGREQNTYDMI